MAPGDTLALGFQEGLCGGAGSEGGSVAAGGDGAVQLTSYKATGEEDPPAGGVSTISHPHPAPPRPPRSLPGGQGQSPVPVGKAGGLRSWQPGEAEGSTAAFPKGPKPLKNLFLRETAGM